MCWQKNWKGSKNFQVFVKSVKACRKIHLYALFFMFFSRKKSKSRKKGEKIDLVINLVTPKEEIIDRMLTRRVCTNPECKATYNIKLHPPVKEGICDKCGAPLKQRDDDSDPEAIKRRLEIYEEKTSPLVEYYKNKGVLRTETVSISINHMGKDVAEEVVRDIKK